ncbi:cyclin-dependent kinase inhibitor 3 family protein [Deinococcus ficus]|uniref:cyclin-dependent kinase inhibitor 3 family protein n=1 Tax=Deinococcus ficus TaxID=317577 RepID=UPI00174EA50B|nr:cyclin-dependent kinase inhibitor 3 family protein [Deinococcus ficus]GHF83755.1 protein-tyrosine-phosphatase [Deinococcus ficus]
MNSHDNPLRVAWIEDPLPRWPGRLGLTIAPGKKGRGTDLHHDRDLATDFHTLRAAGVTRLVNLMEPGEMRRWQMHDYHPQAARAGLSVTPFPIPDVNVPSDPAAFHALVLDLHARLHAGETVVVHCLGGLGRSGMLAACLLVQSGMTAADAIALVRRCRSQKAVEARQPQFVHAYAETVTRAAPR